MEMRKLYYTVNDPVFDDYFEWEHPYDCETAIFLKDIGIKSYTDIVEDCAQEYDNNSNWEDATELDFYLWKRDEPEDEPELLGKFTVYREFHPYFTAFEKK